MTERPGILQAPGFEAGRLKERSFELSVASNKFDGFTENL
jgi:hypothetical protein